MPGGSEFFNSKSNKKNTRDPLANSLVPPLPPPVVPPSVPPEPLQPGQLPQINGDPGFDQLGSYEFQQQGKLNALNDADIQGFLSQYNGLVGDRRAALAKSLTDSAQNQFSLANPGILEDLNARGLSSSPTAVAQAQSQALAGLSAQNNRDLLNFDQYAQQNQDSILEAALNARLTGREDQYGSLFDLGRDKLQGYLDSVAADKELASAGGIAQKNRKTSTKNAFIDAGSNILGGLLSFCFDGMTPVLMADGKPKPIQDILLGEETAGGVVLSTRQSITAPGTRYQYKGVTVTGSHSVKENKKWIHVENSSLSIPLSDGGVVFSLVTDKHRIYIDGIEFADEIETDADLPEKESLSALNSALEVAV